MSDENLNLEEGQSEEKNTGKTIGMVLLVLLGVVIVFVIAVLIGTFRMKLNKQYREIFDIQSKYYKAEQTHEEN